MSIISSEKPFLKKTKVQAVLVGILVEALLTVLQLVASHNGWDIPDTTWLAVHGVVATLIGILLGTHTWTDIVLSKAKIEEQKLTNIALSVGEKLKGIDAKLTGKD